MFCFQCEQTSGGTGCTKFGVCGKSPEVAGLQDLLVYSLKGLSVVALEARKQGLIDKETDRFTAEALFSTLTNVNFDESRFQPLIKKAVILREGLKAQLNLSNQSNIICEEGVSFEPADTVQGMLEQAKRHGINSDKGDNTDIHGLKWLTVYGLKGVAAYTHHAQLLGYEEDKVYEFIYEGLAATLDRDKAVDELLELALKCGEVNLRAMELLDAGNTSRYGHPKPTKVPLGHKKGKAILVSGHDLIDLEEILKQSEGKGIYVYTHGEMLPTHGYPLLKKYKHFYGHYGTAWQNQQREFRNFPGSILMTTNCIQKPVETYKDNIFTSGTVGWPGVTHIGNRNFTPVIKKAIEMPGFKEDTLGQEVNVGFARDTVIGLAGKIIEAVKSGKIRHFFLVGGCDGAKPGRSYYTEFVEKVPKDCVVLTLACGKFRFFEKDLGEIDGIPRLLDIGQCNDSYSAIQIALALANAFNVDVNDLPLSLILSWYEQKAVAILLTLLHLGIKDIRLGPSLPAFITPNVLETLVDKLNIMPITTPDNDLSEILGD